jgi:collagen type I/II/III/V/XI/XXIV/XXVII alpha
MAKEFGGSYSSGITLSNASYNPVSVTGTINVATGTALYGAVGTAWTLSNQGTILTTDTTAAGVSLASGGVVSNAIGALIEGYTGLFASTAVAAVTNAGTISINAGFGDAVLLQAGGMVTNLSGGVIIGGGGGIETNGATTVFNQGAIDAPGALFGIAIHAGGYISNATSGVITGTQFGAYFTNGPGTIVNAGTIGETTTAGLVGNGVGFDAGYANRLIDEPGAAFLGLVDGGNTIGAAYVSTLELASGTTAGTLSGIGTQFNNFGSIVFDAGGTWFIAGNTGGLSGTISGFALGDTIEVTGVNATGSSYSGGVLTINESAGSATLNLPGTFTTASFSVVPVAGGTDIALVAPCFRAGTRIRTERGYLPVETLREGARVLAHFGNGILAPRELVWLGHRAIDCQRHPRPELVWPIRVAAGAFGLRHPVRDLWLSPDHAVFVGGVLIPVKHLVNGSTIAQERINRVTYCHVELERHGVVVAEGLACESYLDTGDRSNFANGGDAITLHPDFASMRWDAEGCVPLVVTGAALEALRQRLNARAKAMVRKARRA